MANDTKNTALTSIEGRFGMWHFSCDAKCKRCLPDVPIDLVSCCVADLPKVNRGCIIDQMTTTFMLRDALVPLAGPVQDPEQNV